jgi:predicted enzyme related to lactoylglutathione lyase
MATRLREPGEFCWINVLTPDVEGAKAFFGAVLGWTFGAIPGGGWFIRVGPSLIGGLFDLGHPQTPPGTPAGIGVMVRVEDADAAVARAKELGGDAKPAFSIGPPGRMAELFAPDGAEVDVWQPGAMPGTDVDPMAPGAPCWFEVVTRDVDRSRAFYGDLFGWTSEVASAGTPGYIEFRREGEMVAGLLPTPEGWDAPPHWGVYFTVEDVDATVKRAEELGGVVRLAPRGVPGVGRYASLGSPRGVYFLVIQHSA